MTMIPTTSGTPNSGAGEAFEQLEKMVAAAKDDYQKAIGGNKAAGTRVRKSMQEIKQQAQAIRVRVLESRSNVP